MKFYSWLIIDILSIENDSCLSLQVSSLFFPSCPLCSALSSLLSSPKLPFFGHTSVWHSSYTVTMLNIWTRNVQVTMGQLLPSSKEIELIKTFPLQCGFYWLMINFDVVNREVMWTTLFFKIFMFRRCPFCFFFPLFLSLSSSILTSNFLANRCAGGRKRNVLTICFFIMMWLRILELWHPLSL